MSHYEPLTDREWELLESLFPKPVKRGRGKPHTPWRNVVNSILMVLIGRVKWSSIPKTDAFATKSASHRWFAIWDKSGFLEELVKAYKAASRKDAEAIHPPRRQRLPKSTSHQIDIELDEEPVYLDNMAGIPSSPVRQEITI